jgi:predicted MFS family arabinose efflux permease
MAALVLSVVPLIVGLSWIGVYDWGSPHVIGSLAAAAVMVVVFLAVESRAAEPIIPLSMFRNRVVSVAMAARFGIGMGMFGVIIFIPLFFQFVMGQSATNSGIILMPMMLGMVLASTLSGQIVSRFGGHYRILAIIGLAVTSVGMYLMSRVTPDTTYARALVNTAVTGVGMGMSLPLFVIAVQNAVPYRIMGIATSSVQFFQSIGQAVGLAVFGSIMANRFASNVIGNDFIAGLHLPQEELSSLTSNPEALMDDRALAGFQAQFGPEIAERFVQAIKECLTLAITDVFFIGAAVVAVAFVVTLFLKEVPLRRSHGPAHVE